MNHMITDDPGTSTYSPYYTGDVCKCCGKSEDVNENGECPECETSDCFLCANMVSTKLLRTVKGKDVCADCIDYEGIDAVRDLILRYNLKIERGLRMLAEKKVDELQKLIKDNCKPVLTH